MYNSCALKLFISTFKDKFSPYLLKTINNRIDIILSLQHFGIFIPEDIIKLLLEYIWEIHILKINNDIENISYSNPKDIEPEKPVGEYYKVPSRIDKDMYYKNYLLKYVNT
jgi:hypothetical protein